jgi:hypothetical protein
VSKEFRIYQTDACCWTIETDEFNFDGLTCDTMNHLADFLLKLGYKEIIEEVGGEND